MRKLKVYLYPNRREHVHDADHRYINTVPLSKKGISDWVTAVGPEDAEFYYMGQVSDGTQGDLRKNDFKFFDQYAARHIVDIEGDWLGQSIPAWLEPAILTINGVDQQVKNDIVFVRPTFSTFLINAAKNRYDNFQPLNHKSFGFRGLPDPHGIRQRMKLVINEIGLPAEIVFNPTWQGPAPQNGQAHRDFESLMLRHLLALAPRGTGKDSVRFYEACFFERVPIIVGDGEILGDRDSGINTKFPFRISGYSNVDEMKDFFVQIFNTDIDELKHRAKQARHYFDNVVRHYFEDPTKSFIGFLDRKGLI